MGVNDHAQVLPRHRQSAAAAAEAMLTNPSPLSGLHKLALSICARKRGTPLQPCARLAGAPGSGNHDKENVTPANPQCLQADASGGWVCACVCLCVCVSVCCASLAD